MSPAYALWGATILAVAMTGVMTAAAAAAGKRHRIIWAAAFGALLLRLAAAHLELRFGPHLALLLAARLSSPLFSLLLLWGVYAHYERKAPWTFVPLVAAGGITEALLSVAKANPLFATAPLELVIIAFCAHLLFIRRGAGFGAIEAVVAILAARPLLRLALAGQSLSPEAALAFSALLWAAPALILLVHTLDSLVGEARTNRLAAETIAGGAGIGVALVDEDGRAAFVNAAFAQALGEPGASLAGAHLAPLLSVKNLAACQLPLPDSSGMVLLLEARDADEPDGGETGRQLFALASALADGAALVDGRTGAVLIADGVWGPLFAGRDESGRVDFWQAAPPGMSGQFRDSILRAAIQGQSFDATIREPGGKASRMRIAVKEVEWDGSLLLQVTALKLPDDGAGERLETSGQLAAGLAHDLKNVLQAILSCADGMALGREGDEASLKAISDAAKKGDGLVRRILDPSKARPEARRVDFARLAEGLAPLARKSSPPELTITFHLPTGPLPVDASPDELEQAVMNLLVNAKEALAGRGRIAVTAWAEGEKAFLAVEDDGPGVPEELRERVFLPLVSTKARSGGLGLSMVRASLERFGGTAVVGRSEALGGAKFLLALPLAPIGSVLLADGDDVARAALDRELKLAGLRVHTTHDGDRALALLREKGDEIAVIVADLVLSGTGGKKFLESVAKIKPEARVVVVSSITSDAARKGAIKAGASVFLAKPVSAENVIKAIGATEKHAHAA